MRRVEYDIIATQEEMRKADLPGEIHDRTWEEPPLVIRDEKGAVGSESDAVSDAAFGKLHKDLAKTIQAFRQALAMLKREGEL